MSQRPRLGDDGRLLLPEWARLGDDGLVVMQPSTRSVDPFSWTEDRLLLAESFARLDLKNTSAIERWWTQNGAVTPASFAQGPLSMPWALERGAVASKGTIYSEWLLEAADEQANVTWHLGTLAHLSAERETKRWDPAWGEFVLAAQDEAYLVGGADAGVMVWSPAPIEQEVGPGTGLGVDAARARVLANEVARRPRVWVHPWGWRDYWGRLTARGMQFVPDEDELRRLGSEWDGILEVEGRLISPYVNLAAERRFRTAFEIRADGRQVWATHEDREWHSVLAPIYLQLFEALRRISEGEPGAAVCRECGRPFLVLDGRRRFYCNERERARYQMRAHRQRAAEGSEA
ncbi:MAG: hypothetical protein ACRDF7_03515 [Candidatus Limnocylindrales bacterium]